VFDHVTIRVSDRAVSERLLRLVLAELDIAPTYEGPDFVEWDDFSLAAAGVGRPATRGLHLAFVAPSRAHVDAFWRAGVDAGLRDDGEPGPRPEYREDYYGSFLRDADGNSIEAVHHGAPRRGGNVDHLWIRVADVDASIRFYDVVAPHAGFSRAREVPARDGIPRRGFYAGASGSFSVVDGPPAANVHLAFPATEDAAVDAFHRAAVRAGYRDNGAPGERPEYHPGYYGAFVLDPDGNNVEVVNHNREHSPSA
jgi:catechol 2,3-dioxygenase-like lactoylglutathione lyase family enzyme